MNFNNCFLYVAGLLAAFAYDDISYNKIATQSHTYQGQSYDASKAVDGNTATCMRTYPIGVTNPDKTVWWKVDLGGVSSIYSVNIQFKSYDSNVERQKGRLAGFSLYVSNSDAISPEAIKKSTLCYKDGPVLPPLNLTKTCIEYGRYVIFYNERLDGIVYQKGYEVTNIFTELCEVIVQGCNKANFYGSKCDKPCPINCKDSTCHIQNGTCFVCKPGWTGLDCDIKCSKGWYGMNCTQQCVGHCRDGVSCNHVTGQCDGGCAAGWKGDLCNKECNDGTYGYNCVNNCSGHCLNNSPCNKQTGQCDRGCNPGYINSNCSKECLPGYFGIGCSGKCSGQCIHNEPCDHVSGGCPSGCKDGFVGTLCNNSCNKGYFGTNCSSVCSSNCQRDQCQHKDGSCTSCAQGWMGYNCTTENLLENQNTSSSILLTIGLSISILINFIFIVCGVLLWRRKKPSKGTLSGTPLSCWKTSLYQDIVVKNDETSTYQELDLSDSAYQNTAIP